MVWAAPTTSLCLCFSTDLVKVAVATLIIGAVLSATEQHPDLSASVPQGFPCIPASDLPAAAVLAFAQGLQNKPAELSSVQLSCLARLLSAKNLTADFGRYPPDLLLFFDLAEVDSGTCGAFYARASHGNLDLLPKGSVQRRELLQRALACLGVRSSHLHPEQLSSLGALVCDMEPETITASDPSVLENLKLCPELTGAQQDALNAVLLGGGTVYGDPSSWDLQTPQSLGPLVLALKQTTLSLVAKATREAFGRTIAATYSSQGHSQWEKSLTLLRAFPAAVALSHPRLKRTTEGCPSSPITASTISTWLVFTYNIKEFNLCLSDEVLKANLKLLSEQPLPRPYLRVMKRKLSQIYPSGIPEKQLKELGTLSRLYTPKEISQWMVTSSDTLLALLDPSDGRWNPAQVNQLLKRYKALGGTLMGSTLTGPLLQTIGGRNLCNLQEEQIDKIPLESIRTAGQLNISSCSQAKKDQLYRKAQKVFADKVESTNVYYCHVWPYLGGASADDLKSLAERGTAINMDMGTFLNLNPKELQKLSVMDVKHLLGKNLHYLKAAENETVVVDWVKRQSQQELDCILGIGLQGGMVEPSPTGTHTSPHPTASASTTDLVPISTTLTTVPIPVAMSSHPNSNSSTSPSEAPTPSTLSPTPPDSISSAAPSAAGGPAPTSTQPALFSGIQSAPTSTTQPAPTSTTQSAPTSTTQSAPTSTTQSAPTSITQSAPTSTTQPAPNSTQPAPTSTQPALFSATQPAPTSIQPALTTGSVIPCSTHQSATSSKATPPSATLLTTLLTAVKSNTTSPSSVPPAAHGTTTPRVGTTPAVTFHNTSTPLVSMSPPAPGGTTHPTPATHSTITLSTHNPPSTPAPNSTSTPTASTATEMNLSPHKPTLIPSSTISTQKSVVSSTAETTTLPCKTSAPPASPSPSSTTTSSETTEKTPAAVPGTPRPTSDGHVNVVPAAGSGSRPSSCLVPILVAALGSSLLWGLL